MIYELYIKNCALIEEMRVEFGKQLNILTGETGSGKSIILGALNLCLGGKYDRTFLRKGHKDGLVEALIYTKNERFIGSLREFGVEIDIEEPIIVSRRLFDDGKTTTRVNGKNIRVSDLKKSMGYLVDMHGQHQNQALYDRDNHLEFLDLYAKDSIQRELSNYKKVFEEYRDIKREILRLNDNKSDREVQREKDLLEFQIKEISSAKLDEKEYEDLKSRRDVFLNSEKIYNALAQSYELMHESEYSADTIAGKVEVLMSPLGKYDSRLEEMRCQSEKIAIEIQDLAQDMRSYMSSIDFDPNVLNEIENRIDTINNLRRKYGDTIGEILEYYDRIVKRLDDIENREEKNNILQDKLSKKLVELEGVAKILSDKRMKVAEKLEESLLSELVSLNMKNTRFKVIFKKIDYNDNGYDDIEFYVSFNLGEDLNPLNKVASGGEMSRFMLAFKNIISDVDKIESMIFDEIDTGISGRAAQVVGEKLAKISENKQVVCITHLPQIAAFADDHYYIEKHIENKRTFTGLCHLEEDGQIDEIARLISGKIISDKTLEHAREMLYGARESKMNFRRGKCE